jgi:type II secretory pathway predicted ATPase ExeA
MYQRFYGLRELPFELTSDPRYLFYTRTHREALSNLQYGLSEAKAVTVLIGEAGTGKTTLLHAALESEACRNVQCVYVNNPTLTRGEFIQSLARWFALGPDAATSKATLLADLEGVLRDRMDRGVTTALVVDEAQSLSAELLEEVRLLANIELPNRKLLPLVLAGQPELSDRLNEPGHRQLKQRVALRCEISAFTVTETAAYMASRIRTAGGDASKLFTREAVMLIHEYSGGIPRTINVLCDNALLSGMAVGRQPVGRDIVFEVIRDFDLRRDPSTHAVESAPLQPPADGTVAERERGLRLRPQGESAPVPPQAANERQTLRPGGDDPAEVRKETDRLSPRSQDGERPSLRLDDLDAQLAEPAMPPKSEIPAQPEAPPRRLFGLFGSGRR